MSLTGKAKLAGIIGWPVTHSLSPVLHGHWLAEYQIDGAMVPLPARAEDFTAIITGIRRAGFTGVNVTVPHKARVFAACDRLLALPDLPQTYRRQTISNRDIACQRLAAIPEPVAEAHSEPQPA